MTKKKNSLDEIQFEKGTDSKETVKRNDLFKKLRDEKLNKYLKIITAIALTLVTIYLFSAVAGQFLSGILSTMGMLLAAFVIAYLLSILLEPVLALLKKMKVNNSSARAAIASLLFLGIIALVVIFVIIPPIKSLMASAASMNIVQSAQNTYTNFMKYIPAWLSKYLESYTQDFGETVSKLNLDKLLPIAVSALGGLIRILATLLYTVLFLFFMLKERDRLVYSFENILPQKYKRHYKNIAKTFESVFKKYIKGHFTVISAMFFLSMITFLILGASFKNAELLKYAFLFALIVAITDLIPYVGPWIGGAFIILLAAFIIANFYIVLALGIAIIVFQLLENILFQPLIMGKSVEVHPLGILTAILFFASMGLGVLGIVLAAPLAGILKVLFRYIKSEMEYSRKLEEEVICEENDKKQAGQAVKTE